MGFARGPLGQRRREHPRVFRDVAVDRVGRQSEDATEIPRPHQRRRGSRLLDERFSVCSHIGPDPTDPEIACQWVFTIYIVLRASDLLLRFMMCLFFCGAYRFFCGYNPPI